MSPATALGASDEGGHPEGFDVAIIVLLVLVAISVFRKRGQGDPPKWMGKLEGATPRLYWATNTIGSPLLPYWAGDIFRSLTWLKEPQPRCRLR